MVNFWATFGIFWAAFFQHLVTLIRRQKPVFKADKYKLVWYSQTNLVIVLHFAILQTQQLTTWANTSLRLLLLTKELHAWSLPIVPC